MDNFKAVFFDLDGTLLDTIDDIGNSMNMVLKSMGYPLHTISEYKYFIGRGLRNLTACALPEEHRNEATTDLCLDKMIQEYSSHWGDKTRPYKGIKKLLDALTEKKIRMAILTNKDHKITTLMVKKFLGRWKFEAVFGERPGVPRKPDPSSAFETAEIMNILPGEIIYLGDSGSDMETAVRAGMCPVGVLWGFRGREELLDHGARHLIESPMELLDIL